MSIRSMVEESLGYVTPEDRQKMHAWEQGIEAERAEAQKGTAATMVNSGLGTSLDMGEKILSGKVFAESGGAVRQRPHVKVREIRETVSEEDLGVEL